MNICRNYIYRLFLTFVLGWSVISVSAVNGYYSDLLEQIATTMSLKKTVEQLPEGYHYKVSTYKNKGITVGVRNGEVAHIGFTLFSDSQRDIIGREVADFIERYWLWLSLPMKRNVNEIEQMIQDQFFFDVGSLETIDALMSDSTLSVSDNIFEYKRHVLEWKDSLQSTVCRVNFPINNELYSGRNILENDRRLPDEIKSTKIPTDSVYYYNNIEPELSDSGFYELIGDTCYIKELSSTRYFELAQDSTYRLIYSPEHSFESVANMLISNEIPEAENYKLTLRLQAYNYKQIFVETNIRQFVTYCLDNGCKAYVGLYGYIDDVIVVELFMRNLLMGYTHVLKMKVNLSEMKDGRGSAIARFNPFIPIANIKKLI